MEICYQCGAELSSEDIGVYKKLVNRGSTQFTCKPCLAKRYRVSVELLDRKIWQFRLQGCMLFPPVTEEELRLHAKAEADGEKSGANSDAKSGTKDS